MIETVSFKNFKALRDVTIPLERLTVLVGPNASGKTSVLQGLSYLDVDPWTYFEGERDPSHLRSRGAKGAVEISCNTALGRRSTSIRITLEERDDRTWSPRVDVTMNGQAFSLKSADDLKALPSLALGYRVDFLRLDAARIASPSYSPEIVPHVAADGEGVAAVLAEMLVSRPDDFRHVEQALRAVIPSVERLRLERAPVRRSEPERITINGKTLTTTVEREYVGHRVVLDMTGAPSLPAFVASEGTLLALGVLTVIIGHEGPHLVLIDDIERGVHPRALGDLVAQLRRLLDLSPDLQIIATSHSPDLIDRLDPKEIRLIKLTKEGAAVTARLDEHPQWDRWKEFMNPGEIWGMVGEDWVLEQAAQHHE